MLPGLLAAPQRLLDLGVLDRAIRGRLVIAVVAFALIGIVTMQLGLLELNAGIAGALDRAGVLQRENAVLGIENSELGAPNRIETRAAALGMELVPSSSLRFLSGDHAPDYRRAADSLKRPLQSAPTTTAKTEAASSEASGAGAGAAAAGDSSAEAASGTAATSSAQGSTGADTQTEDTPAATTTQASAGTEATTAGAPVEAAAGGPAAGTGEAVAGAPSGGTQASAAG